MAEHQTTPAAGSVADEAARLVDALGAWARAGVSDEPRPTADARPETGTHPTAGPGPTVEPETAGASGSPSDDPAEGAAGDPASCHSCGARAGVGRAESCRVCPVCQGISLLRSVRPETVERLADLAAVVASTLRELATQRRDDEPASASASDEDNGAGDGRPSPNDRTREDNHRNGRRAPVQDIDVTGTTTAQPDAKEHG